MTKLFLAPAAGLALPLHDGRPWPAAGAWVEPDEYVRRRVTDGDLVAATPPEEPPAAPEEAGSEAPTEPLPAAPATATPSKRARS